LQGLRGTTFDRAYVDETIRINGQDKTQDEKELAATGDQTVHQLMEQLQAADQKHLKAGEALKQGN